MNIHTEPLNEKIGGLPTLRVIGWSEKKHLTKEFETKLKNTICNVIVEYDMFDKLLTYTGSVGVIANGNFYLINNMSGKDETDGLSLSCVGVMNSLPQEVRAQMVYMGSWSNFQISKTDNKAIPHNYFEIEPDVRYECYARGGYVIFVKGCQDSN